ncbi:MAG: hypothetical protein AAFV43_03545 [Planctomycetota bacterium]
MDNTNAAQPLCVATLKAQASANVRTAERVLRDAVLIEMGTLLDRDPRPWFVDRATLKQVLKLGGSQPYGLKARFAHPDDRPGADKTGRYLGRWRRLRLHPNGHAVVGDLHLAEVAFASACSRGQWLLDMARSSPESIGVSIYPDLDLNAMQNERRLDGKMPIRLRGLVAADIVDDPAASRHGLYGDSVALSVASKIDLNTEAGKLEARQLLGDEHLRQLGMAIEEYRSHRRMLDRQEINGIDYVESAMRDAGLNRLPDELRPSIRLLAQAD